MSLLSQFSKILEKLFDSRLQSFIDKNYILNNSQYGFRANCSTSYALVELIEELSSSLDRNKVTVGVFIDLKKAFDTIDHSLLLRKLERYGIRGKANDWVKSYLHHRKQFVQVDEHQSNLLNIVCGVPQGSVLGPKLFILYINDICNVSKLLHFILFADDTNIFKNGDNLDSLCKEISLELDKLNVWFAVNKLSLNVSKTNYIVFGRKRKLDSVLTIHGTEIERVQVTKFLGVLIDEKLNWSEQIFKVKSKLLKCVGVLYKARIYLDNNAMLMLYNAIILPYLSYCVEVWGNTYKTKLNSIRSIQKRAIRLVCNVTKYEHTSPLFKTVKALKLLELIEYKTCIVMYHAYNSKLPHKLQSLFELGRDSSYYSTRQKHKFKVCYKRTNMKAHCITSIGTTLWNKLPNNIYENKNLYSFKSKLKHFLLSRY